MARLIVAVVHNLDAEHVVATLRDEGHRVTVIPSLGGFLHIDNSTLLVGVEDESTERAVLGVFERECSAREVEVPLVVLGRLKDQLPRMVRHGGATIFLVDLAGIVHV
jgi:uncharacterized protein YaaQ